MNLYRKKRNKTAKIYFKFFGISAALYTVIMMIASIIGDPGSTAAMVFYMVPLMCTSICLIALIPMLIYLAVMTSKANAYDRGKENLADVVSGAYVHTAAEKTESRALGEYLTEQSIREGKATAAEVISFCFGIMEMLFCFTTLATYPKAAPAVIPVGLMFGYLFCISVIRKRSRTRNAMKLARWISRHKKPTIFYEELRSDPPVRNPVRKLRQLVELNYMENVICSDENQAIMLIGLKKIPKHAYICKRCGATQAIPEGERLVCGYCNSPLI